VISRPPSSDRSPSSPAIAPARAVLQRALRLVPGDGIVVREAGRSRAYGRTPGPHPVTVEIDDPRTWPATATGGSAGLGEAYFRGWFRTDDLVGLIRLLIGALERVDRPRDRLAAVRAPFVEPVRRLRRGDPHRDRRDIRAHYDLGNDFFARLLDPTMTYSCAVFADPDEPLESAQRRKIDGWCQRLGLAPQHRLVEIGSGWGALATHAAAHYGCRVTTTTVSAAQHEWVARLIDTQGLGDRVTLLDADYRSLEGRFDRLVSVEMIEAVDWRHLDEYFATCERLLEPDGLAGIQAIVMADQSYHRAKHTEDFIKRWIFPGGCLPSVTAIAESVTRATQLRVVGLTDIGAHYARTLARWREHLWAMADDLDTLGLDRQFLLLFDFYLAYCEAAFLERRISTVQLVLAGPRWRDAA